MELLKIKGSCCSSPLLGVRPLITVLASPFISRSYTYINLHSFTFRRSTQNAWRRQNACSFWQVVFLNQYYQSSLQLLVWITWWISAQWTRWKYHTFLCLERGRAHSTWKYTLYFCNKQECKLPAPYIFPYELCAPPQDILISKLARHLKAHHLLNYKGNTQMQWNYNFLCMSSRQAYFENSDIWVGWLTKVSGCESEK